MSELGDTYKKAEEMVLKRYTTEPGNKGQDQSWKIAAIRDDRLAQRDSSVLTLFADDVEKQVERLLAVRPVVQELCKKACEPKKLVAVEPPQPHGGLDLDWN